MHPRRWWPSRWPFMGAFFLAFLWVILASAGRPLMAQAPAPSTPEPALPEATSPVVPQPAPPAMPIDLDGYWAADCIRLLAQRRLALPDVSGRFYPEDPITWQDFTGVLNLIFPTGTAGSWANPLEMALGLTNSMNVASHYPPQYYIPTRPVVRAEAVMALAAKVGAPFTTTANGILAANLKDARQVPDYAREGVAAALMAGLVVNYPDSRQLNPNQPLTRGAAAALICQASKDPQLQVTLPPEAIPALPTVTRPTPPPQELRGVWLTNIDSEVLFSKDNQAIAVDRLATLNINTLYPTVWNWGYTLYPSQVAERELGDSQHLYGENSTPQREATQAERDMLKELIDLAHARGMKVIPWFEFGFMAPNNYELARRHPDWFTQKWVAPAPAVAPTPGTGPDGMAPGNSPVSNGGDAVAPVSSPPAPTALPALPPTVPPGPQADPRIWLEGNVLPRLWLNPFHPGAQKFILELVNELMTQYEVDGFQVDDHLGLPVEFGYDPFTMARYAAEHGGQPPPENAQDPEWVRWRAEQITNFMGEIYKLVKARRPQAVVSVSPNPYPFSYVNYLQDWPQWEQRGFLDELVVQVYRDNQNSFIWEMAKPSLVESQRRVATGVGVLSGLRGRPVALPWLQAQIDAVRDRDYAGVSFFFYETLWVGPEPPDRRVAGLQESFPNVAQRP